MAAVGLVTFASAVCAQNWPHWRGPDFNGASAGQNLPTEFSRTNNLRWVAELPGPAAATPIVWGDHVFVSSTDFKAKSLRALALDRKTGKEIWKHIRPSEARAESRESFATPIPITHDGKLQFLVAGGDSISAHDLKSGEELWRWGSFNPTRIGHWRLVPSPIANAGVALVCAPKGSPIYAVKLGGKGTLADSDLAWTSAEREVSADVCTPLLYQGKFYVLNGERQTKTLARVDPVTGKMEWVGEIPARAKIECSPTGADGKIYFQNFRGEVFVVAAADEFKILHTTMLGDDGDDKLRATIVPSQGNLFIRTGSKLYCVGK